MNTYGNIFGLVGIDNPNRNWDTIESGDCLLHKITNKPCYCISNENKQISVMFLEYEFSLGHNSNEFSRLSLRDYLNLITIEQLKNKKQT